MVTNANCYINIINLITSHCESILCHYSNLIEIVLKQCSSQSPWELNEEQNSIIFDVTDVLTQEPADTCSVRPNELKQTIN